MKTARATSQEFLESGFRIDASYHASDGMAAKRQLTRWHAEKAASKSICRIDKLDDLANMFVGDWLKRIYVDHPDHGAPYVTGDNILRQHPLDSGKYLSYLHGHYIEQLLLRERMIIMSCSGTIGRLAYVTAILEGAVGSPDLLRILTKEEQVQPGYLFAFLSSSAGQALIAQGSYGGVVQHIEIPYLKGIPVPRLGEELEQRIHEQVEQAGKLRVLANVRLREAKQRFYREVLEIDEREIIWKCRNDHSFATGLTTFDTPFHRLDAFHHVGYVGEAERYLKETTRLGELVEPYQPPMFKRPYTGSDGMPFLSGIDLYDHYPRPHMHISRKMTNLDLYIVDAGTILVQNVGQRYGLFGRPTVLPRHLDRCAVTQHLMRLRPRTASDRGFVYMWLSTEVGRRLLLKQSFGTSMGVLFERSFNDMPAPKCDKQLRHSFEADLEAIIEMRTRANDLEDRAQAFLSDGLGVDAPH